MSIVTITLNDEDEIIKAYNYLDLMEKLNYAIDTRCPCFRAYVRSAFVNCDKKCQTDVKLLMDRIRDIQYGVDSQYSTPDSATNEMYKQIISLQPYPKLEIELEPCVDYDVGATSDTVDRVIFDYYIALINLHQLGYVFIPLRMDNLKMVKTDMRTVVLGEYGFKKCKYMGILNVGLDVYKSNDTAKMKANINELCKLVPELNSYNADNILDYFETYTLI
jgi:hypothetical protein